MRNMEPEKSETKLWEAYFFDRSIHNRNNLFLHYSIWVKKIATTQFAQFRTRTVDWNDCVQNASIALVEAIERFEAARGVPFEAYAFKRIKGAVIDGLPKEKVDQSSTISETDEPLEDSVTHLTIDGSEFDQFIDAVIDIAFAKFLDISSQRSTQFAEDPLNAYIAHREEEKMNQAIGMLPTELRFIVNSHYNHFLTFTQISENVGLSKARVSQLHKEALKKLRHYYESI